MASRRVVQYLLGESLKGDRVEPLNPAIVAELCRAWLALDAAPIAKVPNGKVGQLLFLPVSHDFAGQRVRLVATPASGGPRDG